MTGSGAQITLNVFSNCSEVDVRKIPVKETVESFFACFGRDVVARTVYFIDPSPFRRSYETHRQRISEFHTPLGPFEIHYTYGLAFGYRKSIVLSETEYAFQLEHDWRFNAPLIRHSIEHLVAAMKAGGIDHLRFNQHVNATSRYDVELEETSFASVPMLRTPMRSNNPHLIHVPTYREKWLHLIDPARGKSKGVEENLWRVPNSAIYGPLNYPATIEHNDGRERLRKLGKKLGKPTFNFLIRSGAMEAAFEAEHFVKRRLGRA
ncbi:hypothetical protein T281_00100 [Rhodomicrobium udaipurense JA643]|uniref:Uncharacterized protein n=1 Tax=Rhodomicrobium udaipurense TaxID=1202716 RepID=A0A8I1GHV7_9HYPH|nr:hypothetical protein [Rhodomicrobium udaipurense]KAI96444.1 hypothetical protein T281_00100 [Rhodomicrobium udaipurense JA643]MBJ7544506.1 hypothetical protein [Rhodomicrobium udaipurense]